MTWIYRIKPTKSWGCTKTIDYGGRKVSKKKRRHSHWTQARNLLKIPRKQIIDECLEPQMIPAPYPICNGKGYWRDYSKRKRIPLGNFDYFDDSEVLRYLILKRKHLKHSQIRRLRKARKKLWRLNSEV